MIRDISPYTPTYWLAAFGREIPGGPSVSVRRGLATLAVWTSLAIVAAVQLRRADAATS